MKSWLIAVFVLAASVQLSAKTIDRNIHKTFDVQEGAGLYLKHGDGDVDITSWDRDVIDVSIVYHASFSGLQKLTPDDFEVEFEQRGERISIIGREPRVIVIGSFRTLEYTYTIKAPAFVTLELEGVDGDVSIAGRQNDIQASIVDGDVHITDAAADEINVSSVDGDIELADIAAAVDCHTVDGKIQLDGLQGGPYRAKSVDGDITVENSSGDFQVEAVDGDISAIGVAATKFDAHTTDGRITLEFSDIDQLESNLRSSDGNIRIRLPQGLSATLKIRTGDGRIRTDLSPVDNLEMDDDYFSGAINGGRGLIEVKTGDGNVEIVERQRH